MSKYVSQLHSNCLLMSTWKPFITYFTSKIWHSMWNMTINEVKANDDQKKKKNRLIMKAKHIRLIKCIKNFWNNTEETQCGVITVKTWQTSLTAAQTQVYPHTHVTRHKDFTVHHLLFCLVDVGTAFAQVEVDLIAIVDSLELEQSSVLTLVPQATLVASKDGLTPQPKWDTR